MRILHVDTGPEMRGGQHQTLLLYDLLEAAGYAQTLLAGPAIRARRSCELASWGSVRRHAKLCDIVHAHDARSHTLATLSATSAPIVVARRVAFPVRRSPASRWKYRRAAHFIAISAHVAAILRTGEVPQAKISVVRDAVADEAGRTGSDPGARFRGTPVGNSFRVVSPKSSDPLKCPDLAASAAALADVDLHVSADLTADLPTADALLYLSRTEGLGSAILLAMAFGVPAIASRVGGIPEVVDHESTGLLVENCAAAVAAALRRLRDDTFLRSRLAAAGRARVRTEFTQERLLRETATVYRRVRADSHEPQAGDPA